MKRFVTKYALTDGIQEVEASDHGGGMISFQSRGFTCYIGKRNHFATFDMTTKKDTEQPAQREFPHCPLCGADPFYQLLSRREKVAAYAGIPDPSTAIAKAREALEAVVKTDKQSLAELRVKIPSYKPSQEMLALMEQCREALALLATPKEKA